jgi:hypothetical protein
VRVRSEVAWFAGAIKLTAPARSGFVDTTAASIGEVRAASVHELEDRTVIKEHPSMAGAAGTPAIDARQIYHDRRTNSAAIVVCREVVAVVR